MVTMLWCGHSSVRMFGLMVICIYLDTRLYTRSLDPAKLYFLWIILWGPSFVISYILTLLWSLWWPPMRTQFIILNQPYHTPATRVSQSKKEPSFVALKLVFQLSSWQTLNGWDYKSGSLIEIRLQSSTAWSSTSWLSRSKVVTGNILTSLPSRQCSRYCEGCQKYWFHKLNTRLSTYLKL